MKKEKPYQPIDCNLYDWLEIFAMRGNRVEIHYSAEEGGETLITKAIVKNVFAKNKVEYLELDSGQLIRLDALISVGGININKTC